MQRMASWVIVVISAVLASTANAASMYKCVGENGRAAFSDKPCSPEAEVITVEDVRIGTNMAPSKVAEAQSDLDSAKREQRATSRRYEQAQQELATAPCRAFSSSEVRTLTIRKQISVGMKRADALRAWGSPTRVNGSQHAYHWGNGSSSFFYVKNGCVSTVQGSFMGQ